MKDMISVISHNILYYLEWKSGITGNCMKDSRQTQFRRPLVFLLAVVTLFSFHAYSVTAEVVKQDHHLLLRGPLRGFYHDDPTAHSQAGRDDGVECGIKPLFPSLPPIELIVLRSLSYRVRLSCAHHISSLIMKPSVLTFLAAAAAVSDALVARVSSPLVVDLGYAQYQGVNNATSR